MLLLRQLQGGPALLPSSLVPYIALRGYESHSWDHAKHVNRGRPADKVLPSHQWRVRCALSPNQFLQWPLMLLEVSPAREASDHHSGSRSEPGGKATQKSEGDDEGAGQTEAEVQTGGDSGEE